MDDEDIDAAVAEYEAAVEELERKEEDSQPEPDDDDEPTLGRARAAIRFITGTAPWRENMYQVQHASRARNGAYKARRRAYWQANKDKFLADRKAKRAQGREAMAGLVRKRAGRPPLPEAAKMVEKELAEPLNIEQMVFLGSPDVFGNIQSKIVVPKDLVNYLRLPNLYIDDRPLRWPMFKFSSWAELEPSTRSSYVGSARNALIRSGYKETEEQQAAFDRHLYYDASLDKAYEAEDDEAEEAKDAEAIADIDAEVVKAAVMNAAGGLEAVAAVKQKRKRKPTNRKVFSQNPLRIVDFMLAVDIDPWQVVAKTFETTQANGYASGLAGVTYAYLRYMYERGDYKGVLFRKLLNWSFIFSRYTSVARKDTGDRHASQLTTPEKVANTEDWDTWREAVMDRLRHFFTIKGEGAEIKEAVNPKLPNTYGARPKYQILDNGQRNVYVPSDASLPPWQQAGYPTEKRRPNLRELRDCALLACYSLIAPIRLDWATVEVMTDEEFKKFKTARDAALAPADEQEEGAPVGDIGEAIKSKDRKRKEMNKNIIVVEYAVVKEKNKRGKEVLKQGAPIGVSMAYFAKMKNKAKFKELPVPKKVRQESSLCANILLAYLKERHRVGFESHCLFPANFTPRSEELATGDCFTNSAFGGHLADLAWGLTGKNFTETLMRRSFITWFWEQPGNDPLNQATWDALLPRVHQTSSSTNIGYIKKRSAELEAWLTAHPKATPQERLAEAKRIRQATLNDTGQDNPEVDELELKQQQADKAEIQLAKKEVEEVLLHRRSRRLAGQEVEAEAAEEVVVKEVEAVKPTKAELAAAAKVAKAAAKEAAKAEAAAKKAQEIVEKAAKVKPVMKPVPKAKSVKAKPAEPPPVEEAPIVTRGGRSIKKKLRD